MKNKDILNSNVFVLDSRDLTEIRKALEAYRSNLKDYDNPTARNILKQTTKVYNKMSANSSYKLIKKEEQDKILNSLIKKKVMKEL